MQNRAYSVLSVKSIDEDRRVIRGIATTPSVDRVGDIIDPLGVRFTNPMPLLRAHDHQQPIGSVRFEAPTKDGIGFEAEIPKIEEPGLLKDRVDMAWGEIKHGMVRAVSIGFRPIEYSYIENGGIRFSEVEVFELSAVAIPAQADAIITTIKSLDAQLRAAAGVPEPDEIPAQPQDSAATGKSVRVVKLAEPARDGAKPFVIRTIKRG